MFNANVPDLWYRRLCADLNLLRTRLYVTVMRTKGATARGKERGTTGNNRKCPKAFKLRLLLSPEVKADFAQQLDC